MKSKYLQYLAIPFLSANIALASFNLRDFKEDYNTIASQAAEQFREASELENLTTNSIIEIEPISPEITEPKYNENDSEQLNFGIFVSGAPGMPLIPISDNELIEKDLANPTIIIYSIDNSKTDEERDKNRRRYWRTPKKE